MILKIEVNTWGVQFNDLLPRNSTTIKTKKYKINWFLLKVVVNSIKKKPSMTCPTLWYINSLTWHLSKRRR